MFVSSVIPFAVLWAQVVGSVTSFQLNFDRLLDGSSEKAIVLPNNAEFGGLQLFTRGIENQNDSVFTRIIDADKIKTSIQKLRNNSAATSVQILNKLIDNFGQTKISDLFKTMRKLIQTEKKLSNRSYNSWSISSLNNPNKEHLKKAELLLNVEDLSSAMKTNSKRLIDSLQNIFKNTEMYTLLLNISELLKMQPTLKNYAQPRETALKAFNLDEEDVTKLLPVPTNEKPSVYFELQDEDLPHVKMYVKVTKDGNIFTETVWTEVSSGPRGGTSISMNSRSSARIQNLYRNLPISRIPRPSLNE